MVRDPGLRDGARHPSSPAASPPRGRDQRGRHAFAPRRTQCVEASRRRLPRASCRDWTRRPREGNRHASAPVDMRPPNAEKQACHDEPEDGDTVMGVGLNTKPMKPPIRDSPGLPHRPRRDHSSSRQPAMGHELRRKTEHMRISHYKSVL